MLREFGRAVDDLAAPELRRAILVSIVLSLATLALLWAGATFWLDSLHLAGTPWLDRPLEILGSVAVLLVAWLLFPAVTFLVQGFFLDGVVAAVERRHYPGWPPPRPRGVAAALFSALRLAALAIIANVLILPLYLIPGINLFVYYVLNGYLVGREYYELVAFRRLDGGAARILWRESRGRLVLAGIVDVVLLTIPFLNLLAPVLSAAFAVHVFAGLRRRRAAETFPAGDSSRLMED
jgi:uncharacterized protein involved in cysteine biosynthesis